MLDIVVQKMKDTILFFKDLTRKISLTNVEADK